jgi:hypothetical protein
MIKSIQSSTLSHQIDISNFFLVYPIFFGFAQKHLVVQSIKAIDHDWKKKTRDFFSIVVQIVSSNVRKNRSLVLGHLWLST